MTLLPPGAGNARQGAVVDFYAVLDRVVELLRSRHRVSYRALKEQFGLDDERLDADPHPVAVRARPHRQRGEARAWFGPPDTMVNGDS